MSTGAQAQLGHELLTRLLAVTSPPPPAGAPVPALLTSVLAERRRRAVDALPRPAAPVYAAAYTQPPTPGPSAGPSPWARPDDRSGHDDEPPQLPFARPY